MQITKSIPLPRGDRSTKWPFGDMEVGESVFFENETTNSRAYRAARACGERQNKKFISRREGNGLRIWRQS
jgi:hypothetical protein